MNTHVLLLGANMGSERELFLRACALIQERLAARVICSSVYVSPPWGFTHANMFYNQVVIIHTHEDAFSTLSHCLAIEKELGRQRHHTTQYEARIIDIDILYSNDDVIQSAELVVPHQLLHKRRFALMPLVELLPNLLHPILQKTNLQLLTSCEDNSVVQKLEN